MMDKFNIQTSKRRNRYWLSGIYCRMTRVAEWPEREQDSTVAQFHNVKWYGRPSQYVTITPNPDGA